MRYIDSRFTYLLTYLLYTSLPRIRCDTCIAVCLFISHRPIHCAYRRRDGQAEFTWVADKPGSIRRWFTLPCTDRHSSRIRRRALIATERNVFIYYTVTRRTKSTYGTRLVEIASRDVIIIIIVIILFVIKHITYDICIYGITLTGTTR